MTGKGNKAMNEEFLSQEEIDALLRKTSPDAAADTDGTGPVKQESQMEFTEPPQIDESDESLPTLGAIEQDTLSEVGNISMGAAATALSTMVNRKVKITVPEVFVSPPSVIRDHYPIPCIVVNVEYIKGLSGSNLLVIKERDAAVIGSLMMGEDGKNPPDVLDELYLSAVTEAMNMMMGSASTSMSDLFQQMIDISPPTTQRKDLGHEDLDLGPEGPIICVAFRIEIADLVDSVMLQVIDFEFGREMVTRLLPATEDTAPPAASDPQFAPLQDPEDEAALPDEDDKPPSRFAENGERVEGRNVDLIREIPVKIRAVLGRTHMPIDSILKLGPGHIMELETLDGEPIDVFANDTLIAKGEVVVVGEQFGIRITEIAAPRDRIDSIR